MKSTDVIKEARSLDEAALEEKITGIKEELMRLRFRKAVGQLEHTAQLKTLKRNIARLNTILGEKRRVAAV
ncbi:MAG: 50S ribosomal protein L29 [Bdellovibrionales bacterium]|nr:50S ribosomal protein L29 [Bdellovibrionales bacterium]